VRPPPPRTRAGALTRTNAPPARRTRRRVQENPDLFAWLTGQQEAPPALAANGCFAALKAHVEAQMGALRDDRTRAPPGATWVRGWADTNKPGSEPVTPGAAGRSGPPPPLPGPGAQ